jgi:hypothetical protein
MKEHPSSSALEYPRVEFLSSSAEKYFWKSRRCDVIAALFRRSFAPVSALFHWRNSDRGMSPRARRRG